MKKTINYLAVILLSMTLASCPSEICDPVIGIDNRSNKEIGVGVIFNSEYRKTEEFKQYYTGKYSQFLQSEYYEILQIPPNTKLSFTNLGSGPDWRTYFEHQRIDSLTIVIAEGEHVVSQWLESQADSLLICRRNFTPETVGFLTNKINICIDSSLQVMMQTIKIPNCSE